MKKDYSSRSRLFENLCIILVFVILVLIFILYHRIEQVKTSETEISKLETELAEYKDKCKNLEEELAKYKESEKPSDTHVSLPVTSIGSKRPNVKEPNWITLSEAQGLFPSRVSGDTYEERQENAKEISDIYVRETWQTASDSLFPNKSLEISLYDDRAIISTVNDDELFAFFKPYVLYSPNAETVVLEGLDDRNYFICEFDMVKHEIKISGGQNIDVPDNSFEIIETFDSDGSFAYKDGYLGLWQFGNSICKIKVSKPAGELFDAYGSIPYLDSNSNLIYIKYYQNESYHLESLILASNVKKVTFAYDLDRFIIIQTKDGKYGLIQFKGHYTLDNPTWPNKEDFSILWFGEKEITDLRLGCCGSFSAKGDYLYSLTVEFDITGADAHYSSFMINLYEPDPPVKIDDEFLDSLREYFSPSEFDARYKEALAYIQNLEKAANQT